MKNITKLTLGIIISLLIIITSIMSALSILKEEAVNNYLTISKLNAQAFSKEINQDINNIEQLIVSIPSFLNIYKKEENINNHLRIMQKNYPQIRSINILKNSKILYSSNNYNVGVFIKNMDLFPKPIFDEEVLKISIPWIGRDFINGDNIYNYEEEVNENDPYFIPISKKISAKNEDLEVIINLNLDYFKNRFLTNMDSSHITFELIRIDGILLLSSTKSKTIGKVISDFNILNKTIEKNEVTGIKTIDETKYIITYILTDNYPIVLGVKLNYEKNLLAWNEKQYYFFIITTLILVISMTIALIFFYLYNKKREKEIFSHKRQIQDQEKFRLLFQDSHFLAVVISNNGDIFEMNNESLKFLNETNESLKGKKFWDLNCWDEENKKRIENLVVSDDFKKYQKELLVFDKNGEKRVVDFTLSHVEGAEEKILVAIGLDITERKRKEEKLKQAYSVFRNTRDGIIITDKYTNIIDLNNAFEKITGYLKDEVINRKTNLLKSDSHTSVFYEKMWQGIQKEGYWEGEITNINKDGNEYTEWLTINTIFGEDSEVINYIGVFSDITEQKIKEKLLREKSDILYQQSKMAAMGEMIQNIAHQWRQPLSVISSAATGILVQKEIGVSNEEDEKVSLKAINKSSQYLSETIDDFRNFLKLDKKLEIFRVDKAIEEAISLSNIKINNQEIMFLFNFDEIEINGIKNEFIQVILNILNNAKDALIQNIKIEKYIFIDLYSKNKNVFIKIKDNAGGIPNNIINRIFEPYFTTKHQSKGTGIGLYMSEEIIKNHMNGSLSVVNEVYEYEGIEYKGANFLIKINSE